MRGSDPAGDASFLSPFSSSVAAAAAVVAERRRFRRRRMTVAMIAMRRRRPTATPTPIPIFAPEARPERLSLESPLFEPPLLEPPSVEDEPVPEDVLVPRDPPPVRDAVGLMLPVPPCVALPVPDGLPLVLLPPDPEPSVDAAPVSAGEESLVGLPLGTCPASNLILPPVPVGNDANSARLGASENAVGVNFASSVQLQNDPG